MLLALGVAVLLASPAAGPTAAERIQAAKAALDNLEYETAADEFMIAATDPNASLEERIDANLYAGIANRVLHRDVDARLNFTFVLKHRPQQELPPNTPPKITAFYELVRQEVELNRRPAPAATKAPTTGTTTAPTTAPSEAPPGAGASESDPSGPASADDDALGAARAPALGDGRSGGLGWQIVTGSGLLAVGVGALGVAAVVAIAGEALLTIPSADAGLKTVAQVAGLSALGVAIVPTLIALSGAGLVVWGIVE